MTRSTGSTQSRHHFTFVTSWFLSYVIVVWSVTNETRVRIWREALRLSWRFVQVTIVVWLVALCRFSDVMSLSFCTAMVYSFVIYHRAPVVKRCICVRWVGVCEVACLCRRSCMTLKPCSVMSRLLSTTTPIRHCTTSTNCASMPLQTCVDAYLQALLMDPVCVCRDWVMFLCDVFFQLYENINALKLPMTRLSIIDNYCTRALATNASDATAIFQVLSHGT